MPPPSAAGTRPAFRSARRAHLDAHAVNQAPSETIAENIRCDLFTTVLDWSTEQVRLQEDRVDLLLTRRGVKYLIVEAKRPGLLDGPGSVARALGQAQGTPSSATSTRSRSATGACGTRTT